jgi:hypothetical protein
MAGPEDYSITAAQVAKANAPTPTAAEQAAAINYNTAPATPYNVSYNAATGLSYNPNVTAPAAPAGPAAPAAPTGPAAPVAPTGPIAPTGPTPTGATGSAIVPPAPTNTANAAQMLTALFMSYGLTADIASGISAMKQGGLDDLTIEALMKSPDPAAALKAMNLSTPQMTAAQKTIDSWNQRFAGNVLREKAGLAPLDPATYIAQEDTYKALAARAGLPAATMSGDYLAQVMAANVDPTTFNERINAANAVLDNEDPYVTQQLEQSMGVDRSHQLLHILDSKFAAPLIAQQVQAAKVGAEAARAGTNIDQNYAMQLAAQGVSQGMAQQGFQSIAAQLPGTQELATRFNAFAPAGGVGGALQTATFGTPGGMTQAQAAAELERLKAQETNLFSGSSGAGKGSLMGAEEGVS